MGEAVQQDIPGGGKVQTPPPPFTAEKVWVCNSCGNVNPGGAARCGGCGGQQETETVDTVAGTCPNCTQDRPFIPANGGGVKEQLPDGTLITVPTVPDQYSGDCPHCQQSARDANQALDALKKGDNSQWGKAAARQ